MRPQLTTTSHVTSLTRSSLRCNPPRILPPAFMGMKGGSTLSTPCWTCLLPGQRRPPPHLPGPCSSWSGSQQSRPEFRSATIAMTEIHFVNQIVNITFLCPQRVAIKQVRQRAVTPCLQCKFSST